MGFRSKADQHLRGALGGQRGQDVGGLLEIKGA